MVKENEDENEMSRNYVWFGPEILSGSPDSSYANRRYTRAPR